MRRMNITVKIWLSVGVFALGFILATTLGQVQGLLTEHELGTTSSASIPGGAKGAGRPGRF